MLHIWNRFKTVSAWTLIYLGAIGFGVVLSEAIYGLPKAQNSQSPPLAWCAANVPEDQDPEYQTFEETTDGYLIPGGFLVPCKFFKREANV